jgi:hypothetical protein
MSFNSPLFLKAVSIIAKQQSSSSAATTSSTDILIASGGKGKKKKTTQDVGTSFLTFSFGLHFSYIYLDSLAAFLNPTDFNMIVRARDTITDSIMAEIAQENPDSRNEFENAVRHHIVSFSQRIKVCLVVMDKLMEVFNASRDLAQ